MSYDHRLIFDQVRSELRHRPNSRLSAICCRLGIGRHTVTRILREVGNGGFRALQQEMLRDALARSLQDQAVMTQKERSHALGFAHPSSLARFSRRIRLRQKDNECSE